MDADALSHVNVGDPVGKTVGRRNRREEPWRAQKLGVAIFQQKGMGVCPRGVYRFTSHQEADQWMIQAAATRTKTKLPTP